MSKTREYSTYLKRLLCDGYKFSPVNFWTVFALEMSAYLLTLGASFIIYTLIEVLTSGKPLILNNLKYDLEVNFTTLAIFSTAFVTAIFASSTCHYFARSRSIAVARQFEHYLMRRLVNKLSSIHPREMMTMRDTLVRNISVMMSTDTRTASIGFRIFLYLFPSVLFLLILLPILFYMELQGTLIFVGVILLSLPVFFYINMNASLAAVELEQSQPAASWYRRAMVRQIGATQHPISSDDPTVDRVIQQPAAVKYFDLFEARFRILEINTVFTNLIGVIAMLAFFLWTGWSIIVSEGSLIQLVLYAALLRLTLAALQSLSTVIVAINRFFPNIFRIYQLLSTTVKTGTQTDATGHKKDLTIRIQELGHAKYFSEKLLPGSVSAIVTPNRCSRFSFLELCSPIAIGQIQQFATINSISTSIWDKAGLLQGLWNTSLVGQFSSLSEGQQRQVTKAASHVLGAGESRIDEGHFKKSLTSKKSIFEEYSEAQIFVLLSTYNANLNKSLNIIDANGLELLDDTQLSRLLVLFNKSILIIVGNTPQIEKILGSEAPAFVSNGHQIVNIARVSSLKENRGIIRDIVLEEARKRSFRDSELEVFGQ